MDPGNYAPARRRLPHRYPDGEWLFVTWNLHGSLPASRYPPPGKPAAGQAFAWMDRYLDTTRTGPFFLSQEGIAEIVRKSLFCGERLGHYELGPYVIMPNHVHVLLLPKISPPRLLRSLKGATARAANLVLQRTGELFWRKESYDHWVRSEDEWRKIANYIEGNPVKAGFVANAEEFRWSSARVETSETDAQTASLDTAPTSACATPTVRT